MTAQAMGSLDSVGSGVVVSEIALGTRRFPLTIARFPVRVYKMYGYNATTLAPYYWSTTNPNAGPPNGLTLTNISIVGIVTLKEVGGWDLV